MATLVTPKSFLTSNERRSQTMRDKWAERRRLGVASKRRYRKHLEKTCPQGGGGEVKDRLHHEIVDDYLTALRKVSPKIYRQRVSEAKSKGRITADQAAYLKRMGFERDLPPSSVFVNHNYRVQNNWAMMRRDVRSKIFKGCLDLDVSKCHLTVLNVFRQVLDRLPPIEWPLIEAECLEKGFTKEESKLLVNSSINGAGNRSFSKQMGRKVASSDLPDSIKAVNYPTHKGWGFLLHWRQLVVTSLTSPPKAF